MRITIPEFIRQHSPGQIKELSVGKSAFLVYRQYENNTKNEVLLSMNLVVFVLKGRKLVHYHGGEISLTAGDVSFFRKGNYNITEIYSTDEGFYEAFLVFMADDLIERFVYRNYLLFENFSESPRDAWQCRIKLSPFLKSAVESIFPYFIYSHFYPENVLDFKLQELLLNLLGSESGKELKKIFRSVSVPGDNALRAIMENNYMKPFGIDEFARLACMSLSKFKKDFRAAYGIPSKQWINQRRLELSRRLLVETDFSVTEIGFTSGFENYSYFIKLFRIKYGVTPRHYRILNR